MLDLSVRVFYKAHFNIESKYSDVSLFDEVIYGLYNWLHHKFGQPIVAWNWQQFRKFGEFQTNDGLVEASSTSFKNDGSLFWACKIEEYQVQDSSSHEDNAISEAPRIWTTEVGFEQISHNSATVSYILYYRDKAGFIGKTADAPALTVPSFIKNLLYNQKILCKIGDDILRVHSTLLKCGFGKRFAENIQDERRVVPCILVLPELTEDGIEYRVNAESIAKNVMGNALVYSIDAKEVIDEINFYLSKELHCRQGQIMIYWGSSSTSKFRYISSRQIESLGEQEVVEILRRVFSTDIKYYDAHEMFRMADCDEMYRQHRIKDLRSKMKAVELLSEEKASTNAELKEQLNERDELLKYADEELKSQETQIGALKDQLSEERQENRKLQGYIHTMDPIYKDSQGQLDALHAIRCISSIPKTAMDVGMYFTKVFPEKIDFSERGFKSLNACTTRVETIWECFYQIATHLTDLYRAGSSDMEEDFKTKTGWTLKRGEGKMTRRDKSLMAQRMDSYDGRTIIIEPHVANGNRENDLNFIRVYFAYDPVSRKIIIGHVGKHLENFSTRSI